MKTPIVILSILFSASVLMVAGLYVRYSYESVNDFVRVVKTDFVKVVSEKRIADEKYYVAGASGKLIYFGNRANPLNILITDHYLRELSNVVVDTNSYDMPSLTDAVLKIDSPLFYLIDGKQPKIWRGQLDDWRLDAVFEPGVHFNQAVPVAPATFIIQGVFENQRTRLHENVIGKLKTRIREQSSLQLAPEILGNDDKAFLASTGVMAFDKSLMRLAFVYFYKDQIIQMDTNLHLISQTRLVDITRPLRTDQVEVSRNAFMLSSSGSPAHYDIETHDGYLYVHSGMRARNESKSLFESSSVIDVYDLVRNAYMFSFYLPDRDGASIASLKILNGMIVTTYQGLIVCYSMDGM